MATLFRQGLGGGQGFPTALTTGPAAGGYTSLTPVTGAGYSINGQNPGAYPSWVQVLGDGSLLIKGLAFGEGSSISIVNIEAAAIIGCSIIGAPPPSGAAITFTSPYTTVAVGSNGGEISQIATWGGTYGGNGVLDVASAAAFPSSGTVTVAASGSTTATVTYTGVSGNTLTGCAYVSGSATGTVATGGHVGLQDYGDLTVQYCTIAAQDTVPADRLHECVDGDSQTGTMTIDHCNMYWFEQAVHAASTTVITNSYIHDPIFLTGDHTECVEMPAGTTLSVNNCTLLNSLSQTAVIAGSTAPASYTVTGSLLGGGGYMLYTYTAASDIVVTGNSVTTAYWADGGEFGLMFEAPTWGSSGNVWSGNVWYDGASAGDTIPEPM